MASVTVGGSLQSAAAGPRSADGGAQGNSAAPAESGKKGKKKLIIIVAGALVVLIAGYMAVNTFVIKPPTYTPTHQPADGSTYGLPDETVNLSDGSIVEFTTVLQLTTAANSKTIGTYEPELENALIQDVGEWNYNRLLAPNGKDVLREQLLRSFQQILVPVRGGEQVSNVYFTAFTLQAS